MKNVEYVIRSLSEDPDAPHGAFWSNAHGWTVLTEASRFTTSERMAFHLPVSAGADAEWMLTDEAADLVPPMWTQSTASVFLHQARAHCESMGLRLSIVGSVLTKGASHKDLDLCVHPMEGQQQTLESALARICETFLPAYAVDSPQELNPLPTNDPEPQTFINLGLFDGRTIELYFPERLFPFESDTQTSTGAA